MFQLVSVVLRQKRVEKQLEETDVFLDRYINILSKSERIRQLIFDERRMTAEAVICSLL